MQLISLEFFAFLALVVGVNLLLPPRLRMGWLLAVSCLFYLTYIPAYLAVLAALIAVVYLLALHIRRVSGRTRTIAFIAGVTFSIGLLVLFKYVNFLLGGGAALALFLGWTLPVPLLDLAVPIGLSFHVFQAVSYLIEVHQGRFEPERNVMRFALYIMFFPQLLAGPIERPSALLPQLKTPRRPSREDLWSGAWRILWGVFKKTVVADWLAVFVDHAFSGYAHEAGPFLALGAACFALQLYLDFSAYVDIALGSARMLGVRLDENFRQPYFARSIAEFWRRWHITLSLWFRDYMYVPLAMRLSRRLGAAGIYASVMLTFLAIGLWHGANMTFVVSGLLHGSYLVVGRLSNGFRRRAAQAIGFVHAPRLRAAAQTLTTFALVAFSCIFFRAPTVHEALAYTARLLNGWTDAASWRSAFFSLHASGLDLSRLLCLGAAATLVFGVEWLEYRGSAPFATLRRIPLFLRVALYYALVALILIGGRFAAQPFVYFSY